MLESISSPAVPASPFSPEQLQALAPLVPTLQQVAALLLSFRQDPVTPQSTLAFEQSLQDLLRQAGLAAVSFTFNSLEPSDKQDMPQGPKLQGTRYRPRRKTPWIFSCLFGSFKLHSWLYEPRESGESCIHPLEHLLGMAGRAATPALAAKVGTLSAQHTQSTVLALLDQEHDVTWSCHTLRQVAADVAVAMGQQRPLAQVQQILDWLQRAMQRRHGTLPVLVSGRDGVMVSIVGEKKQREAAVATLSVYDRKRRRVGTVYLGVMPQSGQATLTEQMSWLLKEVLRRWTDRRLRLLYVTDAGNHQQAYYHDVLRRMKDPARAGELLDWEWVVDYYHASGYITQMAAGLFGDTARGKQWARRMRQLLKEEGGAVRVLQSASYQRNQQKPSGDRAKEYQQGYAYLAKYGKQMNYARCKRLGLPLGSGVTEAGCKVTVSQRFKQSGMKWTIKGGQAVMNLRVVLLSGIWHTCWLSHLAKLSNSVAHTYNAFSLAILQNAA
jgi:hypothetical protein